MTSPLPPGAASQAGVGDTDAASELQRLRGQLLVAEAEIERLRTEAAGDAVDGALLAANQQLVLALLRSQVESESAESLQETGNHLPVRDALTGLPGRAALLERFKLAMPAADVRKEQLGVLFLDLDGFKQINDRLGHRAGDAVLRHVTKCVDASVRGADMVSRHGGDEFVILLTELQQPTDAGRVAEKILRRLLAPEPIGVHVVSMSASIGISIYPDDGRDPEELIHQADGAMYRAKRQGSGRYVFHDPEQATHDRLAASRIPIDVIHPHAASVARDQLRQGQMQEANERLLAAALGADEIRPGDEPGRGGQTALLAMVAHELRNPLTPIRTAASLMDRADPGDLPRLRAVIERQVDHVARLVGDLLDLSRVHAGKLRLDLSVVDACTVVPEVLDACRPAIEARRQRLLVAMPGQPLLINGDRVRLVQVLSNLLDNACKYTPEEGTITLAVHGTARDLVVEVSDTGIGIRAAAMATVFHPFVQDSHATNFNGAGLGIGLTVVRELVEAHGGSVRASSAGEGQGSRFVLNIPRHGGEQPE